MHDEQGDSGDSSGMRDHRLVDAAKKQIEAMDGNDSTAAASPSPRGQALGKKATGPLPDSFSGYDLVRELHRGGQGIVYQAIQRTTKRKVAIKVLREGPFASPRERARFEREVQVLGQLNHRNIVGIHDSGVAAGCFYYVMDYISGQQLDVYVASRGRSIAEVLELFAKVCTAVSAAHVRGVIHRDLKPGNIRVDAEGEPYVLDFGLAKTIMGEMTDGTRAEVMSVTGQFIGSMPWAAPEQAEGIPSRIDVRTDVYALGVILFQILTGRFPYDVAGAPHEVLHNVVHTEPIKPSRLRRQIDNELETIILKCLSKDRERRYLSAGELARDIRHYLAGEPIEAKRDSGLYVLRKSLRRYRSRILIGMLVVAMFCGGGAIGLSILNEEMRQRQFNDDLAGVEKMITEHKNIVEAIDRLGKLNQTFPEDNRTYFLMGTARSIQALNARLEDKPRLTYLAIEDFQRAHMAAGGELIPGSPRPSSVHASGSGRGSPEGIRAIANLTMLNDSDANTAALPELADRVGRLLVLASQIEGSIHSHPQSVRTPFAYDLSKDPLIADKLPDDSPRQARLAFDDNAEIDWLLPRPVISLNPIAAPSPEEIYVRDMVFDWLYVVRERSECVSNPVIVSKVEVSHADPLNWDISLNPDVWWHDGRPLTAEDVHFSWQFAKASGKAKNVDDVIIQDLHKVTVRLEKNLPNATWHLRIPLLPKHRYELLATEKMNAERVEQGRELSSKPIGCGPYRVENSHKDGSVTLLRWDRYPVDNDEGPYLKRIYFKYVQDRPERVRRLANAGEALADAVELSADEFRWHVNGDSFRDRVIKVYAEKYQYDYIGWNLTHPILGASTDLRRAMARAVDLPTLRETLFSNLYKPCLGIFEGRPFVKSRLSGEFSFDRRAAKQLLDQAGWLPDSTIGGVRSRGGVPLRFNLLVPAPDSLISPTALLAALQIKEDLWKIGVDVTVEAVSWTPDFANRIRRENRKFDACFSSVITNPDPSLEDVRWASTGERNIVGFANTNVDQLFKEANSPGGGDEESPGQKYERIGQIIYDEQPYLFLWQKPSMWAFSKRLRGIKMSSFGPVMFHPGPRAWWIAKESSRGTN